MKTNDAWQPNNPIPEAPSNKAEHSKKYDELSLHYANELFNHKIEKMIKAISSEAYAKDKIGFVRRYPIMKILTFLSKKLFLNCLELIFLQYILEENKWRIKDEVIKRNNALVKDFMNNSDVSDPEEYRCLLFYLVLSSYSAKYYLNDPETMKVFLEELNSMIAEFQVHFKEWNKHNPAITSKISPKTLNNIFRTLNRSDNSGNYFLMVESIIDISPPYNNNQKKPTTSKKPQVHYNSNNQNLRGAEENSSAAPDSMQVMPPAQNVPSSTFTRANNAPTNSSLLYSNISRDSLEGVSLRKVNMDGTVMSRHEASSSVFNRTIPPSLSNSEVVQPEPPQEVLGQIEIGLKHTDSIIEDVPVFKRRDTSFIDTMGYEQMVEKRVMEDRGQQN